VKRKLVIASVVSALCSVTGSVLAAGDAVAAPTQARQEPAATAVNAAVHASLDRRTMTLSVTPVDGSRTAYDAAGRPVGRQVLRSAVQPRVLRPRSGKAAKELSAKTAADDFACFDTGNGNPNFFIYEPINLLATDLWGAEPAGDLSGEYIWQNYAILGARRLPDGPSIVFVGCTVGSWKTNNGFQQVKSGVALEALTSPDAGDRLLAGANPGRQDGGSVTSSASFQATWGPVQVGASLPLTGTGTYTGNFGSQETDIAADPFGTSPQNEVNAWWHDGSLILPGTSDPVNETNEALWEWPFSDHNGIDFWWSSGYRYNCPNFNCG
jgi:hypothetical protein